MFNEQAQKNLAKILLAELGEDPSYKFKLVFSVMSIIPFLAFFYIIFSIVNYAEIFFAERSIILLLSIFLSIFGFSWGYVIIKNLLQKIISYALKVKHSEQIKSELVAAISHDFKIPISVLKLSLSAIISHSMGHINKKQTDHLESCENILAHLQRTISTLLDLYKIEAGMVALKREPCDLVPIIEEQLKEFDIMFSERKIKLSKKIHGSGLFALIDKDKIVEVINNLLGNALKYAPTNGTITVEAFASKGFIRMEFINSGECIPFDKLNTIFEKFHKLDSQEEGTGLGLAIAKDIVQIHQGSLWAENLPTKGVKFVAILPRPV